MCELWWCLFTVNGRRMLFLDIRALLRRFQVVLIMHFLFSLPLSLAWVALVHADWKVYQPKNQVIFGGSALNYTVTASATGSAAFANYTAAAENDATTLTPPAVPNPPIPTVVPVQLATGGIPNLSAQVNGAFFGFSVEMSVANQVCESSYHPSLGALTDSRPSQWEGTGALFSTPPSPNLNAHQLLLTGSLLKPHAKYCQPCRLGPSPCWW